MFWLTLFQEDLLKLLVVNLHVEESEGSKLIPLLDFATLKFLFLIILGDFNNMGSYLYNVCGINDSLPMNNPFFIIKMKAY